MREVGVQIGNSDGWLRDGRTRSSTQLTLLPDILSNELVHNSGQLNALKNELFHWNRF
jgi:hypothetical protein